MVLWTRLAPAPRSPGGGMSDKAVPVRWEVAKDGGALSPIGRTKTTTSGPLSSMKFAFASCQQYEHGYYTAYKHMANEDLDVIIHLGDYIYEYSTNSYTAGGGGNVRGRSNHEVDDNWAGVAPGDGSPPKSYSNRKAAAFQAYWEHMPLPRASGTATTSVLKRMSNSGTTTFSGSAGMQLDNHNADGSPGSVPRSTPTRPP
jgi:alkaline phosphatase D